MPHPSALAFLPNKKLEMEKLIKFENEINTEKQKFKK
jgi:hypothetical protein